MSIRGKAFIVGSYEHPRRHMPDKSVSQIHAEVCIAALEDAGLTLSDVDGLFYTGQTLYMGGTALSDYLGLNNLRALDTTMTGGSSPLFHIGHAAMAIAAGRCNVALISLAARPRSERQNRVHPNPEASFEQV
jgi:acetyl-CoA C-acetyltransferase